MGIEQQKVDPHWNYYLCIEEDILKLSRWIELSERNYECYSLEIARLLMATAAEVDVVAKLVCKKINPKSKATGIKSYQSEILKEFPNLWRAEVLIPRNGLKLHPWSNWEENDKSPLWWQANNNVKHQRSEFFDQATLKNLLNAVAALLLLLILYYQVDFNLVKPFPTLFIPNSLVVKIGENYMYMNNY